MSLCYDGTVHRRGRRLGRRRRPRPCWFWRNWSQRGGNRQRGQANPTSTEAVEAVVQGLKNNYVTFKDRSRGIRLERKWSDEATFLRPGRIIHSLCQGWRRPSVLGIFQRGGCVFLVCASMYERMCVCVFARVSKRQRERERESVFVYNNVCVRLGRADAQVGLRPRWPAPYSKWGGGGGGARSGAGCISCT